MGPQNKRMHAQCVVALLTRHPQCGKDPPRNSGDGAVHVHQSILLAHLVPRRIVSVPAVQICLVILILIIVAMTKEVLRRIYVEPGFPPRPQDEIGAHRPSPEEHAGVEAPVSQSERFALIAQPSPHGLVDDQTRQRLLLSPMICVATLLVVRDDEGIVNLPRTNSTAWHPCRGTKISWRWERTTWQGQSREGGPTPDGGGLWLCRRCRICESRRRTSN